jgi:competence protein ComEA
VDVTGEDRGRLARLATWLEASPAELAGLAVLVAGAMIATLLLWLDAGQRPDELPSAAGVVGTPVEAADAYDLDGAVPPNHGDDAQDPGTVTVHVTGAVVAPGLVTLPAGARVGDAVVAAGGVTAEADPERINLARPVQDGEHVHLPRIGEDAAPPSATADGGGGGGGGLDPQGRVDLNRASEEELQTLPGIGPAKARAIVAHREEHGPFAEPGDLRAVSGIGERTFQQLADLVVVR